MHTKSESRISSIEEYGYQVVGPILLEYVSWVLERAQRQGLKKLYFLARDGNILCEIARRVCSARSILIECRYLYCSRYALRNASFCILSREETLELVGGKSVQMSLDLLLERCRFTAEQKEAVALACGVSEIYAPLDEATLATCMGKLKDCDLFWSALREQSAQAHEVCLAYLRQERLFEGNVAIVDSGWSGSMQRSLRQLLQSAGFSGKLQGFYFGLYQQPKSKEDGIYESFYFCYNNRLREKAWFNNNLFECMLAAPHGMTMGYEEKQGIVSPILREKRSAQEVSLVEQQERGILRYTQAHLASVVDGTKERFARCTALVRRCMVHPTVEEVGLLSAFQFCDDTTEGYFLPLAEVGTMQTLNTRLLPVRLLRKLSHGRLCGRHHPFVWYYAATVGAPRFLQPLYRWNEFLWECARLWKK